MIRKKSNIENRGFFNKKEFKMITPINVEEKKDEFEFIRDKYLRQQGWIYSCEHPMAIWLWEKEIEGKWYRLPVELAYDMEQYIHEYEEDGDDG